LNRERDQEGNWETRSPEMVGGGEKKKARKGSERVTMEVLVRLGGKGGEKKIDTTSPTEWSWKIGNHEEGVGTFEGGGGGGCPFLFGRGSLSV